MAGMLTSFKFRVTTVDSGESALEELTRESTGNDPYLLVIMDWKMPGMDGIETIRRIRQELRIPPLPAIIMITAFGADELQHQIRQIDYISMMTKPVQPQALLNTILAAFNKAEHFQAAPPKRSTPKLQDLSKKRKAARILLVEDNLINQQVAGEILEHAGMVVDIAKNGREAVEAVAGETRYDLIFMDLQMPEMDGYEATRLIRLMEVGATVPIIAMTAHAMVEERQQCLDAGMNDHLSKPIDLQRLYDVLMKWLPDKLKTSLSGIREKSPQVFKADVLLPENLPGINVSAVSARLSGDKNLLGDLIIIFRAEHCNLVEDIRQAFKQYDYRQAGALIHTLKGVAGNIGAEKLAELSQIIENQLRAANMNSIPMLLDSLSSEIDLVFEAARRIENLRENSVIAQEHPANHIDINQLSSDVEELARLLALNKMEARKKFTQIKAQLPDSSELAMMEASLKLLDFKEALGILEKIKKTAGLPIVEQQ